MAIVAVSVISDLTISWQAPTQNVDGSQLTDLASYRIYYGTQSGSYTQSVDVTDATATQHSFSAASGEYFVTMTALDMDGNESAYATEIVRSAP